jgi:hypothetical protein
MHEYRTLKIHAHDCVPFKRDKHEEGEVAARTPSIVSWAHTAHGVSPKVTPLGVSVHAMDCER